MVTKNKEEALKAIFFDGVGTLFYLTKTVGDHYALVGSEVGLTLHAHKLDRAFYTAWEQMPPRPAIDGPRENDDKDWWRQLVDLVLGQGLVITRLIYLLSILCLVRLRRH